MTDRSLQVQRPDPFAGQYPTPAPTVAPPTGLPTGLPQVSLVGALNTPPTGATPPPGATPFPYYGGTPPTVVPRYAPPIARIRTAAQTALNNPTYTPTVDMPTLYRVAPLGTGFWERLYSDSLTATDKMMALPAGNFEANPDLVNDVYAQHALLAARPTPNPLQRLVQNTVGLFGGGTTPTPAVPGAPGDMSAYPSAGMGGPIPPTSSGFNAGVEASFRDPSAALPYVIVQGTAADPTQYAQDKATGKVFARKSLDINGGRRWEPAGNWGDTDIQSSITQYGPLLGMDPGVILKLQQAQQSITKEGQDMANAQAKATLDNELGRITNDAASFKLTTEQAKAESDIALSKYTAERAKIDLEASKIDLLMKPIAQQLQQEQLATAQLQRRQMEARYPLELQQLQEAMATQREQRLSAERTRLTSIANDRYARDVYPGMISALAVRGPDDGSGGSGPPPIYGQLARGAGLSPDDPAAQMAYTVLQQQMGGVHAAQMAPAPAPQGAPAPVPGAPPQAPPAAPLTGSPPMTTLPPTGATP